jgi:hypothetical protein
VDAKDKFFSKWKNFKSLHHQLIDDLIKSIRKKVLFLHQIKKKQKWLRIELLQ